MIYVYVTYRIICMYIILRERCELSSRWRSSSCRLGLRPGSSRLRSQALDLRFSRALAAGLVPRPPPGLSPRALSGSRAADEKSDPALCSFRWILRDGKTYKKLLLFLFASLLNKNGFIVLLLLLLLLLLLPSSFDMSLPSLGLAVYRFL